VFDVPIDLQVQKDEQVTPWKVDNWNSPILGEYNWKSALAISLNCAAANVAMKMGTMQMADGLEKSGAYSNLTNDENLSHLGWPYTLGVSDNSIGNMATMYSTFANGGLRVNTAPITSIKDGEGNPIYTYVERPGTRQRVFSTKVAEEIVDALGNNIYRPSGETNPIWKPILQEPGEKAFFAKTGTAEPTEAGRHSWTVGATDDIAIAVYVHSDSNSTASGLNCAAPLFRKIKKGLEG